MLMGSRLTARQGRVERVTGLSLGLVAITVVILVVGAVVSEPVFNPWVLTVIAPFVLGAGLIVLVITFGAFLIIDRLVRSSRWATWLGLGSFVLAWACVLGVEFGGLSESLALVTLIFGGEALVFVLGVTGISSWWDRSHRNTEVELTP